MRDLITINLYYYTEFNYIIIINEFGKIGNVSLRSTKVSREREEQVDV